MVKTQQAAVVMWSTCKVVHHVHSLHRHVLRLGCFLRRLCGSAPGGSGQPARLSMTPSTAAFRGVWGVPLVLMRNYEPNPFESVQVVYLVKLRMADKGAGKRAPHAPAGGAAAGLVSVSTTCRTIVSEGKPPSALGSVPPAAPQISILCRFTPH